MSLNSTKIPNPRMRYIPSWISLHLQIRLRLSSHYTFLWEISPQTKITPPRIKTGIRSRPYRTWRLIPHSKPQSHFSLAGTDPPREIYRLRSLPVPTFGATKSLSKSIVVCYIANRKTSLFWVPRKQRPRNSNTSLLRLPDIRLATQQKGSNNRILHPFLNGLSRVLQGNQYHKPRIKMHKP